MPTPADKSNSKESEGVAVIDRACAILFAFRPDDAALTLADSSDELRQLRNVELFGSPIGKPDMNAGRIPIQ